MNTKRLIAVAGSIILAIAVISWTFPPTVPDFSHYEVGTERKEVFFSYFRPLIEQRNQEILEIRDQLRIWRGERESISWWNVWVIEGLADDYGMKAFDIKNERHWSSLLARVDIVPTSLALAQAAKESAWGTSRFAREAYNYFGQWCFEKGCGVVPASREPGAHHEIADFDSPEASVESYIHNLNSYSAYKRLREIRAWLRAEDNPVTGIALTSGLAEYSERRGEYTEELRTLINYNNLSQYDAD